MGETENEDNSMHTFDDLIEHLGVGRWSVLYFLTASLYTACCAMQALSGGFIMPLMNYTCIPPDFHGLPSMVQDSPPSSYSYIPTATNITTTITVIDECRYEVLSQDGVNRVESCTQWDFDHTDFGNTLTSQMSLVCERSFLVPLYQSVYMFGSACGASLGGLLSDKLGRHGVFMVLVILLVLMGSGMALLSNIFIILAARTALGFLHTASMQSSFVLVMETSTSRTRPLAGMLVMVPWALGISVYGGLGYAIRHWRYLQLSATLPFVVFFPLLWVIDESPRWLLVRGELEKAQKVVDKAARWQKVEAPSRATLQHIMGRLQKQSKEEAKKYNTAWDWMYKQALDLVVLFRTKQLCMMTVVVCTCFFSASLVYYGLSLSAVNFSTDPYIFMALGGLAEIPSYTLTGPVLLKLGRKPPAIFCFLITGISLMLLPFISAELEWARITLAMVGRVCISAVFVEFFLYASEVFPTEVRLQGLGTGLLFSRLGSIISPFINDILVPLYPWMTSVVFGGLSVLAGIATFILPETRDKRMPDVVEDLNKPIIPDKTEKVKEKPDLEDLSMLA